MQYCAVYARIRAFSQDSCIAAEKTQHPPIYDLWFSGTLLIINGKYVDILFTSNDCLFQIK